MAAREELGGRDGEEYFLRPKASFFELLLEEKIQLRPVKG